MMENKWENYGDVNFVEYGGTLLQQQEDGKYNAIVVKVENEDSKFLATFTDVEPDKEKAETVKEMADRLYDEFEQTGVANAYYVSLEEWHEKSGMFVSASSMEELRASNEKINHCLEYYGADEFVDHSFDESRQQEEEADEPEP